MTTASPRPDRGPTSMHCILPRPRAAFVLGLFLLPGLAFAGNGVTGITIAREPNLASAAIQAIVSGDDDTTAVLRIFQKWRENPAYDTGMVMTRRLGTHIYEGRVLWMVPGRSVYYFVAATDAAGGYTTAMHFVRV